MHEETPGKAVLQDWTTALFAAAERYEASGDVTRALAVCQQLLHCLDERDSCDPFAVLLACRCLRAMGRTQDAVDMQTKYEDELIGYTDSSSDHTSTNESNGGGTSDCDGSGDGSSDDRSSDGWPGDREPQGGDSAAEGSCDGDAPLSGAGGI